MTTSKCREVLVNQPPGTFLIRFSSSPPQYTLCVTDTSGVIQWRITSEKIAVDTIALRMQDEETPFSSLYELVEHYKYNPLTIKDGNNKRSAFLKKPYERSTQT